MIYQYHRLFYLPAFPFMEKSVLLHLNLNVFKVGLPISIFSIKGKYDDLT